VKKIAVSFGAAASLIYRSRLFDVQTGRHQGNPRLRLRPVIEIFDGDVMVTVPEGGRERIARARFEKGRATSALSRGARPKLEVETEKPARVVG